MRSGICITKVGNGSCGAFLSVLTRILKRVAKWAEFGKMKSFVKQTEIKMELEECYRDLQTCSMRFNVRRVSLRFRFRVLRITLLNPFTLVVDRIASECK